MKGCKNEMEKDSLPQENKPISTPPTQQMIKANPPRNREDILKEIEAIRPGFFLNCMAFHMGLEEDPQSIKAWSLCDKLSMGCGTMTGTGMGVYTAVILTSKISLLYQLLTPIACGAIGWTYGASFSTSCGLVRNSIFNPVLDDRTKRLVELQWELSQITK